MPESRLAFDMVVVGFMAFPCSRKVVDSSRNIFQTPPLDAFRDTGSNSRSRHYVRLYEEVLTSIFQKNIDIDHDDSGSKSGSIPRPGRSDAVILPFTRFGAPLAISTVP